MISQKSSKKKYIGIDTSCYTTSFAVCSEDGEMIFKYRKLLPVREHQLGLRQSDGVFAHVKNLDRLFGEIDPEMLSDIHGVCASSKPRAAEGSYMPVFLVGETAVLN